MASNRAATRIGTSNSKRRRGQGSDGGGSGAWIIAGLVVVLLIIFFFENDQNRASTLGGSTAVSSQPPPRVSWSGGKQVSAKFSCAAYGAGAAGGLRMAPPRILELCQRCSAGEEWACKEVYEYVRRNSEKP
jgi:hypothetical protein